MSDPYNLPVTERPGSIFMAPRMTTHRGRETQDSRMIVQIYRRSPRKVYTRSLWRDGIVTYNGSGLWLNEWRRQVAAMTPVESDGGCGMDSLLDAARKIDHPGIARHTHNACTGSNEPGQEGSRYS